MIANKLPQIMTRHGPFRARFYRIRFSTSIEQLEEERIIATLYGCMVRRMLRSPYLYQNVIPKDVYLQYNNCKGAIVPIEQNKQEFLEKAEKWEEALSIIENPIDEKNQGEELKFLMENEGAFLSSKGKIYGLRANTIQIKNKYKILVWEIISCEGREYQKWGKTENEITLLDFASIPIKKKGIHNQERKAGWELIFKEEEENEANKREKGEKPYEKNRVIKTIFLDQKEREYFRRNYRYEYLDEPDNDEVWSVISVQRSEKNHGKDYANWPLEIKVFVKGKVKVFPAIGKSEEVPEQQNIVLQKYGKVRGVIEEIAKEKELNILKCEVSLSRNGEKQRWNLES